MDQVAVSEQVGTSWKFYAATLSAMIALAGLDFIGAMFAKEWADRGRIPMFLLGWVAFTILYFVYAHILKIAELSTVTIGWIVFLQVGLLVLDVVHYGVRMPWHKWTAIGLIIALQIYLIVVPNLEPAEQSEEHANAAVVQGLPMSVERAP
jgi:hypothetical protein